MISKLESPLPIVQGPARRAGSRGESPDAPSQDPVTGDPDLRVTLSPAARRLAVAPEAPGEPEQPEAAGARAERTGLGRAVAYREEARPVLGERLSIRV